MGFLDSIGGIIGGLGEGISGILGGVAKPAGQAATGIGAGIYSQQAANQLADALKAAYGPLTQAYQQGGQMLNQTAQQGAGMVGGAGQDATSLQLSMLDQARQGVQPWAGSGVNALAQLTAGLTTPGGAFQGQMTPQEFLQNLDPGYGWRKQQGIDALASSGAAAGNYGSGNMGTALQDYGQNLASNEYQNAWNRYNTGQQQLIQNLGRLSTMGEGAATNQGAWGVGTGQNIGNQMLQSALAQAGLMMQGAQGEYGGNVAGAAAGTQGDISSATARYGGSNAFLNQSLGGLGNALQSLGLNNIPGLSTGLSNGAYDSSILGLDSGAGSYLGDAFGGWDAASAAGGGEELLSLLSLI